MASNSHLILIILINLPFEFLETIDDKFGCTKNGMHESCGCQSKALRTSTTSTISLLGHSLQCGHKDVPHWFSIIPGG